MAPVIGYSILALALPGVFYVVRPRSVWFSIAAAVVLDLILYWNEFSYYESRPVALLLMLVQIIVMTLIILMLKFVSSKMKT